MPHSQPTPQPSRIQDVVSIGGRQTLKEGAVKVDLGEVVDVDVFATIKMACVFLQLLQGHDPRIVRCAHFRHGPSQIRQMVLVFPLECGRALLHTLFLCLQQFLSVYQVVRDLLFLGLMLWFPIP